MADVVDDAPGSLVDTIEEHCRSQYARWDSALWHSICEGPARELARALHEAGEGREQGEALLESYLQLAADGIGLGYLVPGALGRQTFFTLAWTRLLPRSLASLPPEARSSTLADCFNLGENLAHGPGWLHRIFVRLAAARDDLGDLQALVDDVAKRAQGSPGSKLGDRPRIEWVHLAGDDPRFLPGAMHFVAPTVACVHDRRRTGGGGRAAATVGVWLTAPPLSLGPMGCDETPEEDEGLDDARLALLEHLETADPRAADYRGLLANEWRGVVTLETSQFVVILLP